MLDKLKEEFIVKNDDYTNDVNNFIEYLDVKRGKDSFYNELIIGGMTTDEIINSLKYLNIDINRIKRKSPAYKYTSAIGELFYYIYQNSNIQNSDFLKQIESKKEESYSRKCSEFINNCATLEGSEVYTALDDETVDKLLKWCDNEINTMLDKDQQKHERIGFKHMTVALCVKLMLLTGITYREVITLRFSALNTKVNTIEINNYIFRLPLKLSVQFMHYKELCKEKKFDTDHGYLFTDQNGKEWGKKTASSCAPTYLDTVIGQKDFTGIIKYGIRNLILVGIDTNIIKQITGAKDDIIKDCINHNENDDVWFSYINSKIVSSTLYGKL